jgi:hypothetical protein
MSSRKRNCAPKGFAAFAIVGAVCSLVHAAGGIPAEMDAARASEYRTVLTMVREIDAVRMSDSLREQCLSWQLSKADALAFLSQADWISPEHLHSSY